MATLFRIRSTDRCHLEWREVRTAADGSSHHVRPGRLIVRPVRDDVDLEVWRSFPVGAEHDATWQVGPALREETDYKLVLQADAGHTISILHRDPNLLSDVDGESPALQTGVVNFRGQIGYSTFTVLVDEQPEFDFEVEVFPTKLDYQTDYAQIMAEVQDTLSGLAFAYLRATWQGASQVDAPSATNAEWLILLRTVFDELERALGHIAHRPIRGLVRTGQIRRLDQIRRVDSRVRSALRRGGAARRSVELEPGIVVAERLAEYRPQPTLDTMEHRWLAAQVERVRLRLQEIIGVEQEQQRERPSDRHQRVLAELVPLELQAAHWARLEPIAAATSLPPGGVQSLQLMTAPGYREAYRACMVLGMGLRLDGGPLQLSVKDLNQLYEYWCYLALLRLVAEVAKVPIDPRQILELRERGLSVLLRRGTEQAVRYNLPDGRRLTARYNPDMGQDALVPQRPDMLLTMEEDGWPAVHLVLDAKYRVDSTTKYRERYGTEGPPDDALNTMHRYRDAILDDSSGQARRTVVQAAAVFPLNPDPEAYAEGKLWRSLNRIGVGAIPLLPGSDGFLREWLVRTIGTGGWGRADQATDHVARAQAHEWTRAATQPVLIGALHGDAATAQLASLQAEHRFYTPAAKDQPRLFAASAVAFYEPASMTASGVGAVRWYADVLDVRLVPRQGVPHLWAIGLSAGCADVVAYDLGPLMRLPVLIVNREDVGRARPMPVRLWSSRLGLLRARRLSEVFLETEPEWRLYEGLRAAGCAFRLVVDEPRLLEEAQLRGRVRFELADGRTVAWLGAAGFALRYVAGSELTFGTVDAVIAAAHSSILRAAGD